MIQLLLLLLGQQSWWFWWRYHRRLDHCARQAGWVEDERLATWLWQTRWLWFHHLNSLLGLASRLCCGLGLRLGLTDGLRCSTLRWLTGLRTCKTTSSCRLVLINLLKANGIFHKNRYNKPSLKRPLKNRPNKVLKTNGSLMKVKSIAECSLGAFCNTFHLHQAIISLENQFWSSFWVATQDRFYCTGKSGWTIVYTVRLQAITEKKTIIIFSLNINLT